MPTGYTSDIYSGKKEVFAKDYIMKCAKAFGACMSLREDPLDKEIPEFFEADVSYNEDNIKKCQLEMHKYKKMTKQEIEDLINSDYHHELKHKEERMKWILELKSRYEKVLDEVKKWEPPTSEHYKLKTFAIEQLKNSIDFDCNLNYYQKMEITKLPYQEWIDSRIDDCLSQISYHSKQMEDEIRKTKEKNEWIKKLKDSLEVLNKR